LRAGNPSQAVAACADALRFGDLIARDASYLITWLVAVSHLAGSADQATVLANEPGMSEGDLSGLLLAVNAVTPLERGLERSFKANYMMMDEAIRQVEKGTMEIPHGNDGFQKPGWLPLSRSYLFQPNRCRLAAAELARTEIRAVSRCVAEPLPILNVSGLTGEESKFDLLRKPNMLGRILLSVVASDGIRFTTTRARAEGRLDGARLVVALRLFEKRTGKLPATLAELVPAYLTAVPRDSYDGKPFRNKPEKRLVYALGEDLKDSGGPKAPRRKPGERLQTSPDEVFELLARP
jgi:hypothetical protein